MLVFPSYILIHTPLHKYIARVRERVRDRKRDFLFPLFYYPKLRKPQHKCKRNKKTGKVIISLKI